MPIAAGAIDVCVALPYCLHFLLQLGIIWTAQVQSTALEPESIFIISSATSAPLSTNSIQRRGRNQNIAGKNWTSE
uniref:Putative secreted protein n=1 Tax=Anopheles darlingi TaxID=43151 RepID=A0A2M4DGH3_ANODA